MPLDAIICDWNGTLIEYRDERPLLETIAIDVFRASLPFHPFRMTRILKARRQLETLYREKRLAADFDFVRAMFTIYNEKIINGTPVSIIRRSIEQYANSQLTQQALDHRVLRTVKECHRSGKMTGILSAGYKYGIERVLTVAGYHQYFDFCEADHLKEGGGRAIEFGLVIYKRKHELLLTLLSDLGLEASRVAYIGDSEDDKGCFQIVGYPVLAFLTPDEVKDSYAQEYKAFVPESEKDLVEYLRSA